MEFWYLVLGAFLSLFGALFHGMVGHKKYIGNVNSSNLPNVSKSLSLVSWHVFTIFLILSSWFADFSIDNEFIHYAILTVAIPVSAFALIKGFKNHKKLSYFVYGFFGLFLLAFAVLAAGITGEIGEKSLTLLGSLFVIYAHYNNHQICKELNCDCHNLESS